MQLFNKWIHIIDPPKEYENFPLILPGQSFKGLSMRAKQKQRSDYQILADVLEEQLKKQEEENN